MTTKGISFKGISCSAGASLPRSPPTQGYLMLGHRVQWQESVERILGTSLDKVVCGLHGNHHGNC